MCDCVCVCVHASLFPPVSLVNGDNYHFTGSAKMTALGVGTAQCFCRSPCFSMSNHEREGGREGGRGGEGGRRGEGRGERGVEEKR